MHVLPRVLAAVTLAALFLLTPSVSPAQEKPSKKWSDFCCFEKSRQEKGGRVMIIYHWHHKRVDEYAKLIREQLGNAVKVSSKPGERRGCATQADHHPRRRRGRLQPPHGG